MQLIFTHADIICVSIALIRLCDSLCVCVCPYDKTKMAETKIDKLGTGIVHRWLGGLLVERRTSVSQIRGSIPSQVAAV